MCELYAHNRAQSPLAARSTNMEGWPSGLRRWSRKPVGEQSPREFESLPLRQTSHMPSSIAQTDAFLWIVLAFAALNIGIFAWLLTLRLRLKALLASKTGENLEKIITAQTREIAKLKDDVKRLSVHTRTLETHAHAALQKIGVVRFNPFKDAGSNQSFTIALLNHRNDGIILSNLANHTSARFYTKPIVGGKSSHNLSTEEQTALKQASNASVRAKTKGNAS